MSTRLQTYRIAPDQKLGGEIAVPGDKSISHRAVMLGAIADGRTTIRGFLESEDCLATLGALAQMGVRSERPSDDVLNIEGVGMGSLR